MSRAPFTSTILLQGALDVLILKASALEALLSPRRRLATGRTDFQPDTQSAA